jgi:hypothetical protein
MEQFTCPLFGVPESRTGYIICRVQCKMKMQSILLKSDQECQNDTSKTPQQT